MDAVDSGIGEVSREVPAEIKTEVTAMLDYNDALSSLNTAQKRNSDPTTISTLQKGKQMAEQVLRDQGIADVALSFVNAYNYGRQMEKLAAQGKSSQEIEPYRILTENTITNITAKGWNANEIDARLEAMHQLGKTRNTTIGTK